MVLFNYICPTIILTDSTSKTPYVQYLALNVLYSVTIGLICSDNTETVAWFTGINNDVPRLFLLSLNGIVQFIELSCWKLWSPIMNQFVSYLDRFYNVSVLVFTI